METILIMAQALAKASLLEILRLDRAAKCITIKCDDPTKLKELMEKLKKGEI